MTRSILAGSLIIACCLAGVADAQGYYRNRLIRNPLTGRMEVVRYNGNYNPSLGPFRDDRSFYGARFDPFSGTVIQSEVRRNPYTGRLDVQNRYVNPWTGAKLQTATQYNPYTGRYETAQELTPPNRPLPLDDETAATANEQTPTGRPVRERPRVIETNPVDSTPYLPPGLVDPKQLEALEKNQPDATEETPADDS